MPTQGGRKSASVIQSLTDTPYKFSFIQATRLLERVVLLGNNQVSSSRRTGNPVARFAPPNTEAVRFHSNQTLSFQSSEVHKVARSTRKSVPGQWGVTTNFMGITGSGGVMPYHYTETILKRLKLKDKSMSNFFDLFNHRAISLFYQASVKYNLPLEYERKQLDAISGKKSDSHTSILLSLIGLGTQYLSERLYTRNESLIYYGGLLSQKTRNAVSLKQILQSHFNVPIEIQEFVGQWQDLIDDVRTKLPNAYNRNGQNHCLGKDIMLGKRGWFAQGKIRIVIGPVPHDKLNQFAPGTTSLKALSEIVRLYVGFECDFDFQIKVNREDVPTEVKMTKENPPVMGWNTWISSRPVMSTGKKEATKINISAGRYK